MTGRWRFPATSSNSRPSGGQARPRVAPAENQTALRGRTEVLKGGGSLSADLAPQLFESLRRSQHRAFIKMAAQDLHPDGHAGTGAAAWDTDSRYTGQIAGDRIDVGQVHG